MKHYTLDEVMSWGPCYSREEVKALFAGRRTITLLDVLDMRLRTDDMAWAAVRMERRLVERFGREAGAYQRLDVWLRKQLERGKDPVLERLEKVEDRVENIRERVSKLECPSPWELETERRLDALAALLKMGIPGSYQPCNPPEKPKTRAANCKHCGNADCKFHGYDQVGWRDCFVEKPETCGTCRWAYWRESDGDGVCFITSKAYHLGKFYIAENFEACSKYEAIK